MSAARIRIIAHRGASARAPENTLAALALARRLGADEAEVDARLCGTGEVVVFHDAELDRLTGERGLVARAPLARLRALRVLGAEPIPTLEEVLRFPERPPGLVVELKTDRWHGIGVARRVAPLLRETGALERGPVVVSSFNPLALALLRGAAPEIPRALLVEAAAPRPRRDLWFRRLAAPGELHLEASSIDRARVERAGIPVVAWTVNDPVEARRLQACGVAGIITDAPDTIREALAAAERAEPAEPAPGPR